MSLDTSRVRDVRRIAVLRASRLGDLVFALPALDALRAAYPDAEIVLLALPWHDAFLRARPGPVDRVIPLPDGVSADGDSSLTPAQRDAALRPISDEAWDLALQLHGGGRNSNPIVLALGARVTAGCRTPDAPALDRELPFNYYQPEVLRNLEVVGLVGAAPVGFLPRLATTDDDVRALADAAPELTEASPHQAAVAVVHPGVSDSRRRWPAPCFAAVADRLVRAGARVVVTGTGDEAPLVDEVLGAMEEPALDLAGRLDLQALAALLARAAVVVGNDTGPLHLAEAVGAATVGVYWCGNVINGASPYRRRHRIAISWQLDCPVCGVDCTRGTCEHRDSWVAGVPIDEVAGHALDLLRREASTPPTSTRVVAAPASG